MANQVTVPCLWDGLNVFRNNESVTVRVDSAVIGIVSKPSGPVIPGYAASETVDTLQIKDSVLGDFYLSITEAEWAEAVSVASGSPNLSKTLTYTIGTDVDAGDTITSSDLANVTILAIWIDYIEQDIRNIEYASANGEGTLTFPNELAEDQVVGVVCQNN